MSQQILQVDQAMLETTLDRMVRKSVEEMPNVMLDAEADEITAAVGELLLGARYQRCMVHFERNILAGGQPREPGLGRGRAEDRVLHGVEGQGTGEGRIRR